MKRTLLVLATGMLAFANTYAQNNSSAWPTSGPVGIATTAPTHSLTLGSAGTGFAIYNTADQTTNLERLRQYWSSNAFTIATEASGTGVVRNLLIGTQSRKMTIAEGGSPLGFFQLIGSTGTANASVASVSGSLSQSTGWSRGFSILNAIYNTGTASYSALWISPFQSTLGSGSKFLIDAGTNSAGNGAGVHSSKFVVTNEGNVGIGTTLPYSNLHISGLGGSVNGDDQNPIVGGGLAVQANTGSRSTNIGAQIEFVIPANTDGTNLWGQGRIITVAGSALGGDATGKMILGTRRSFNKLGAGNQWYYGDDIVIDGSGNVSIGTSDAKGYKFAVAGSVVSESVVVKLKGSWPDYVFKKDYHLLSLSEIEEYIKQHQHLPEMPSAADVEKNGLNLGETNKLLTKKVEELTLFLIEKDKEIRSLKEKQQIFEQKLNQLLSDHNSN